MERVKKICEEVKAAGGRAFLVGGIVRDKFLNLESKDIDLEVFGIEPNVLKSIVEKFGKAKECGKSFGVLKLDDLDISMPRRERKVGEGHKGFEVEVDPHMTVEEACSRRDLTINSMLFDPLTDELIDPFNGLNDLEDKVLRHVNDIRFAEDPLRVLRVAQFHARFDFRVHESTNELCRVLLDELKHLSFERLFIELGKILLKAERPSKAFEWMLEFGVLDELFPEISALEKIEQGRKFHPEGNCFVHTMLALDSIPKSERTLTLMLAILCHDFGKVVTGGELNPDDPEHISFHGHAEAGVAVTETFMGRITTDRELTKNVCDLVEFHMRPLELKANPKKRLVRRLALKVDVPLLLKVHEADIRGRMMEPEGVDTLLEIFEEIKNEIKPLVQGKHLIELGLTPSREFGIILKEIFEAQLDGVFTTEEDAVKFTKSFIAEMV